MSNYRLFPTTNGPNTPVDFGAGFEFLSATGFWITKETIYFAGYWWWVCGTNQSTAPQTFCLWQDTANLDGQGEQGVVIQDSVITSGNFVAGQWNWVPLPHPIPLTQYVSYRAATGSPRYAPTTDGQFGSNGIYATGITEGPLFGFADASSGNTKDVDFYQGNNCSWQDGTLDPTSMYPGLGSNGFNVWLDVQVTDQIPANSTYRCWPNQPNPLYPPEAKLPFTISTQIAVSQSAQVLKLWFMSQAGNQKLPSICGIWDTQTQQVVAGTENQSPTWLLSDGSSASPGDGWCYCDYTSANIVLAANRNYRVATGMYDPNFVWYSGAQGYWLDNGGQYPSLGTGAAHGAGNGIIACVPCNLSPNPLSPCPQDTSGSWAYPNEVEGDGDNYYIDLEVSPANTSTGSNVNSSAFLVFFP